MIPIIRCQARILIDCMEVRMRSACTVCTRNASDRSALNSEEGGITRIDPAIPILKTLKRGRVTKKEQGAASGSDGAAFSNLEVRREVPSAHTASEAKKSERSLDKVKRLLQVHGSSFCEELGIDLKSGNRDALWQWLCAAVLFSTRIKSTAGATACQALMSAGLDSPEAMSSISKEHCQHLLLQNGYDRYEEKAASFLVDDARQLLSQYAGDLNRLRNAAQRDPAQERSLLKKFRGIGDGGVDIFFREVQLVWEEISPFADKKALKAARLLDLQLSPQDLLDLCDGNLTKYVRLIAALVRVEQSKAYRVSGVPSVGSATPRSGTGGREVVSASLDGLVHALDGLKSSLGYDDYSTVRALIEDLRTENEELRSYAETAIREAQRLKDAHDGFAERLAQRELEDSVAKAAAESQRLATLADEFDREEASSRREEVERAKREAEGLRTRILELEEENGSLEGRLRRALMQADERSREVSSRPANGAVIGASTIVSDNGSTSSSAKLKELEMQNEDLRREVTSLTETMFGKTFKAPSAWAEREIRYKRDEQAWAEARRELESELDRVRDELQVAKDAEDTEDWRARIAALEARLVESENERQGLAQRLHELELRERAAPGEFEGRGGARVVGATGAGASPSRVVEHINQGKPHVVVDAEQLQGRLLAALQERDALRGQLTARGGVTAPIGATAVSATTIDNNDDVDVSGAAAAWDTARSSRAAQEERLESLQNKLAVADDERRAALGALRPHLPRSLAAESVENELESKIEAANLVSALVPTLEAELLAVEEAVNSAQLEAHEEIRAPEDEDRLIEHLAELRDKKEELLGKLLEIEIETQGVSADDQGAASTHGDDNGIEDLASREAAEARLLSSLVARNALLAEIAQAEKKAGAAAATFEPAAGGTLGTINHDKVVVAGTAPSRESSDVSIPADSLAADRAAADAAWADYAASSDLPGLRKAKAELEARCSLLEEQMTKMAGELQQADEHQADMEARVHAAVKSGDITPLKEHAQRKEGSRKGGKTRARLTLGKMFKNFTGSRPSSREDEADEAKNDKVNSIAGTAMTTNTALEQQAPLVPAPLSEVEQELQAARAENSMIMEHLVMTKVRMAEMEGDYLETRRELLRAREKQLDLAKKLAAYKSGQPGELNVPTRRATTLPSVSSFQAEEERRSPPGNGLSQQQVPSDRLSTQQARSTHDSPMRNAAERQHSPLAAAQIAAESSQVGETAPAVLSPPTPALESQNDGNATPSPKRAGILSASPLSATVKALRIPGL